MDFIDFHTHRPTAEGVITPRSFGIHPWDVDNEAADSYEFFEKQYDTQFESADLVGECGLDKVCSSDWNRQMQLFEWQLRIARQMEKPVVIHCVRAFNELVQLRKRYGDGLWVVHGFIGTVEQARQLFRVGIWTSYGAALLDPRRTKVRDCLRDNPHPFLLETDDSEADIRAIYAEAASIKKKALAELKETIKNNYTTLLQHNRR